MQIESYKFYTLTTLPSPTFPPAEGLRVIGRALAIGFVSALGWKVLISDPKLAHIARINAVSITFILFQSLSRREFLHYTRLFTSFALGNFIEQQQ